MRWPAERTTGVTLALVAGFALRAVFIAHHPHFAGDALVYGELAHNMLAHHVYGLSDGSLYSTLIRLPGYPLFLAACFRLFGDGNFLAVLWVQLVIDLATCGLIALLAYRVAGRRVALWALWLSALCPFTANYVAAAIAETCSLFCVALALYALQRWREEWCAARTGFRWAAVVGIALAWAVLLRPDQGLLAAAVVPVMLWAGVRGGGGSLMRRMAPAAVASLVVAMTLGVWAVRNWRVFHVVQPLAPKYANEPGEAVTQGFYRWFRTWAVGYPATVNVYWRYDGEPMRMEDLPERAFDNEAQREETEAIFAKYNEESASTAPVDAAFARLAEERVRASWFRYYVELPIGRLGDMWFRPRIELMRVPLDWWRMREHVWDSLIAYAMGALNVVYLALAAVGAWMWRRARRGALGWSMALFVAMRCGLLLTIDNSEPRYVLECYPVVLLLAAVAVGMWRGEEYPGAKAPLPGRS